MELKSVNAWLRKKVVLEALLTVLGGLAAVAAALIVLAVMLGIAHFFFAAVWRDFGRVGGSSEWRTRSAPMPWSWMILFSIVVLVLLFAGNEWTRRERRKRQAELSKEDSRAVPALIKREDPAVEMLVDLLFAGPRLVLTALDMFRKSVRLLRLDVAICSRILVLLLTRNSRFSFREICAALPELNPTKTLPQLRDIVGVVFLTQEPCGLSLTKDLRDEIHGVLRIKPAPILHAAPAPPEEAPAAPDPPTERTLDHLEVLGLEPSASLPELERAYRRLMKDSDPNRVAGLGPELEEIAREKAEDIYEAYRAFLEKHDQSRGQ